MAKLAKNTRGRVAGPAMVHVIRPYLLLWTCELYTYSSFPTHGDLVRSTPIDIDIMTGSHRESGIRQDLPPFDNSVDPRVKRFKTRRLLIRKQNLHTNGWRLSYVEYENLNRLYKFTIKGCCDFSGLNRHGTLPYYSVFFF